MKQLKNYPCLMIWVLISSQAPLFRRSGVAIYQLLVFFRRMSILLKMCFSASDKMDDVPVWNKLAYFTNVRGINLFIFLLPPPVENILPYATFTSLNELSRFFFFFFDRNHTATQTGQNLTLRMGMKITESCLAQFHHLSFPFCDIYFLEKKIPGFWF